MNSRTVRRYSMVGALAFLAVPLAAGCGGQDPLDGDPEKAIADAWNQAYEDQANAKGDSSCSGTVLPDQRGFNHRIALTFDDGPNLTTTPKVLAILAAHNAKGTFFVNGKGVTTEAHRQLLAKMIAEGHIVGNHSQNHLNLKTVDAGTLESEVEATHQVLLKAGEQPRFFRFPFGSAGCSQVSAVRAKGYAVVGWHIDSADWCYASPTGGVGYCDPRTFKWVDDQYRHDIVGNVLSQARATGGGVLLFHDIHANTVNNLDAILTALEQDGFSIVPLSDKETFPLLNGANPVTQPWVGTPCSQDSECAFTVNGEKGSCYTFGSNGFCTYSCNGTCQDRPGTSVTFCTSLDGQSGMCVAKSSGLNQSCAGIPGTAEVSSDRFIGQSSSSAASAIVCLPK